MDQAFQVRAARETDRDVLLRFHRGLYQDHRDRVVAPEDLPLVEYRDYDRVLRDDLDTLMREPTAHVLVAELDGLAIGYITGRVAVESERVLPRRGVVEDWYVDENARGQRVGRRLLEALERRFLEAGCQVIESATWSGNVGARRVHEALGFREIRLIYRKRL